MLRAKTYHFWAFLGVGPFWGGATFGSIFGWFLVHCNGDTCIFGRPFSEKAPRVDSNPRATSGVLSGHLVSGGNHYTTPAVAG